MQSLTHLKDIGDHIVKGWRAGGLLVLELQHEQNVKIAMYSELKGGKKIAKPKMLPICIAFCLFHLSKMNRQLEIR